MKVLKTHHLWKNKLYIVQSHLLNEILICFRFVVFTVVQTLPTMPYAGIFSIHLSERSLVKKGRNIYLGPSTIEVNSNIVCHFNVEIGIFFNSSVVLVIYVLMFLLTLLVKGYWEWIKVEFCFVNSAWSDLFLSHWSAVRINLLMSVQHFEDIIKKIKLLWWWVPQKCL